MRDYAGTDFFGGWVGREVECPHLHPAIDESGHPGSTPSLRQGGAPGFCGCADPEESLLLPLLISGFGRVILGAFWKVWETGLLQDAEDVGFGKHSHDGHGVFSVGELEGLLRTGINGGRSRGFKPVVPILQIQRAGFLKRDTLLSPLSINR